MKQLMFAISDTKAEAYLPPFMMRTEFEAQRAFADSVNKPGTLLNEHPEDFCLYLIGIYDQDSGVLVPCEHKSLGLGKDFVKHEA